MEEKEKDIFSGIGQRYWWVNEESKAVLNRGYLLRGETVEDAINRIVKAMVSYISTNNDTEKQYYFDLFKEIIEKGWISLSSPIWANMGTSRGLPISCNNITISDSMSSISEKLAEVMMQTKLGAGTSGYFGNLRGRGAAITNNGVSSGAVSFMELFNTTMNVVSQGSTRRGSFAAYLDIDHPDIEEFLTIKDIGSPIQNLFYGVCVPDYWMKTMINEDGTYPEEDVKRNRKIWSKVLESRQFKGLPYIFFSDNVNKNKPEIYKAVGGKIVQFDDCLWELFDPSNPASFFAEGNSDLAELADEFVAINNEVVDYAHELGLTVWTHNCRGNYESRSAAEGTYEAIAKKFLAEQHYDRFFLEWDSDTAGDIKALEALKDSKAEVVLGLLSSKTTDLDDEERVLDLLEKASQILPKERLFLSHQCGFASCDSGNELATPQQWTKIKQGQEIAKKFFG